MRSALVFALLAVAALLAPARALATLPGANGRIAFSAFGDIYTVEPDGSGLQQVVRSAEDEKYDWFPAWSPDGTRIATSGEVLEPPNAFGDRLWSADDLEVFNADGTGFTRFTTPRQHFSGDASWSPDGGRIAYDSDYVGDGSIYVVGADGTNPRLLVEGSQHAGAFEPAWSPDGQWIVFAREVDDYDATDLFLVRPDGTGLHRLLDRPGVEVDPSWSPDGKSIVFSGSDPRVDDPPAGYHYDAYSIYVVAADGGAPARLTTARYDGSPVFSPDGREIAFQRDVIGPGGADDTHVWVMDADGADPHVLTDLGCLQCDPDWQRVPPFPAPPPAPPEPPAGSPAPAHIHVPVQPVRPSVASTAPPRLAVLRLSRASLRPHYGVGVRLSFRLSAPARVTFRLSRAGSTRAVRVTRLARPSGDSRVPLRDLAPPRLAPGRYALSAAPQDGRGARVTFRVLRSR